jgi:drug/metabolite transporter (DMT)-like permease
MMERRALTAHVLLFLILGLGVGCGTVVTKLGLAGTNPIVFAFYRNVAAAAFLLPAAWWLERRPCLPCCGGKDALKVIGVGCLLFTTNLFYTLGIKLSDGVVGAAWQVTGPVFTAAYAMCLGREKPTVLKCCGFLVAVGGASFVLLFRTGDAAGGGGGGGGGGGNTSNASNSSSPNVSLPRPAMNAPPSMYFAGNMCFLVNVNAYALYSICAKPLLQRYPALTLTTWSFALVSVLMLAAVLITSADPTLHAFVCDDCGAAAAAGDTPLRPLGDWAIPTPMAALALALMILIFSVGQYSVVNWANTFVQTSKITLYMTFQPAIAVVFTMVLLVSGYDHHAGAAGGGGRGGGGTKHPALQPPGPNLAGVVGIVLGLFMVLYEDLVGAGGEGRGGGGDTSTTRLLTPPDSSLYRQCEGRREHKVRAVEEAEH